MPGYQKIIGHEQIIHHMKLAIRYDRVSHAYILSGEAGMGKRTLAEAFMLALMCEKKEEEPCMACHGCIQAMTGNHPDLIYVTHEKAGSIGVDEIRHQVNDTVAVKPYYGGRKVYLIPDAQLMTPAAQNALLKTIEEPPSYCVILLLTDNPQAFLPTILSRCIHLPLKEVAEDQIRQYLITEKKTDRQEAELAASFARGNLGKAIGIVEGDSFRSLLTSATDLLKQIPECDITDMMERIRLLKEEKTDFPQLLDLFQIWYRDVLLLKTGTDSCLLIMKEEEEALSREAQHRSLHELEEIHEAIMKARFRLQANVNTEMTMELLLLTLRG